MHRARSYGQIDRFFARTFFFLFFLEGLPIKQSEKRKGPLEAEAICHERRSCNGRARAPFARRDYKYIITFPFPRLSPYALAFLGRRYTCDACRYDGLSPQITADAAARATTGGKDDAPAGARRRDSRSPPPVCPSYRLR